MLRMLTYVLLLLLLMTAIVTNCVAFPNEKIATIDYAVVNVKRNAAVKSTLKHGQRQEERCLNIVGIIKRTFVSRKKKEAGKSNKANECGKWIQIEHGCNLPPWMAIIEKTITKGDTIKRTRAFGTLISSNLVLTIDSIFGSGYTKTNTVVYLGQPEMTPERNAPKWNIDGDQTYGGKGKKITLVTLKPSVDFSAPTNVNIRPVCLPNKDFRVVDGLKLTVFYTTFINYIGHRGEPAQKQVLAYGNYEPVTPIIKTKKQPQENEQPVPLKDAENACLSSSYQHFQVVIADGAGATHHVTTEGGTAAADAHHILVGVVQQHGLNSDTNMLEVNTDKFRKWISGKRGLF